jgi:hypothetical protein
MTRSTRATPAGVSRSTSRHTRSQRKAYRYYANVMYIGPHQMLMEYNSAMHMRRRRYANHRRTMRLLTALNRMAMRVWVGDTDERRL